MSRPVPSILPPRLVCVLLLSAATAFVTPARGQDVDTLALEAHARFLAHDLLEGRGTGSAGEGIAALYLESRFRALGLEPLAGDDYRLPVPLVSVRFDPSMTALRIAFDGDETHVLRPPDFYHPGGGGAAFRDFGGRLLDAGASPGALEALRGFDDLDGRVVVLGPPWEGIGEVEAEILRRGGAGTLSLIPNDPFYDRLRTVRGPVRYFLREPVDDPVNQGALPGVVGGPALIRALGLEGEIRPGRTLERARPTGSRVEVTWSLRSDSLTAWNVAARLEGSDPALADQPIVYLAHYDHVGYGQPAAGDSIWNGFVDNAAGVAAVLEIARALAADPPPTPAIFLLVTAEEQGLLGSSRFVADPPIPLEDVRLVVNIDAGAPVAPPTSWWISAGHLGDLEGAVRRAVERRGWTLDVRPANTHSDHWSFLRAGVPALFLVPGSEMEGVTAEDVETLGERFVHPHTPHDEWAPGFPFAGLARYAGLALEIGRAVASAPR